MTTVKEAVKALYKQIYLKRWDRYYAECDYPMFGGPVLYYYGTHAEIPAEQKIFIDSLGFNLQDFTHKVGDKDYTWCHIQYDGRDLTREELYFENLRYLAEISGYDIRDCPLESWQCAIGWGFYGETADKASTIISDFGRKLNLSFGTGRYAFNGGYAGWAYCFAQISGKTLFNIAREIVTPKFVPSSNYISWDSEEIYPEGTTKIPVGKKVRVVAKIKNEGPIGNITWEAGYWEGEVWKPFSGCRKGAVGFASGGEITFTCDFRMPDKDIDLIFAAYGDNPLKDPLKNKYLCTDTLTFYLKKVTVAPTLVFDVYAGRTKAWIFSIDVDYYWVVRPGETGWNLERHVLRAQGEFTNIGAPATVRLQAWNLTDKKEICRKEKHLKTDEGSGFQCGDFTITKDINVELRALYQDATGKWIIGARTDTFYLRVGSEPPCEEGAHEVLEYCPDGVTEKRWRDCISDVWVENSRICPAPPECEEGAHEVLEYCLDGVTEKRWWDCISGKWVKNSQICPTTCSDGEKACKGYDLYECKDGEYKLIERNSGECGYVPPKPVCPILEAFGFACVIHPDLVTLRAFRDAVLPRIMVKAYYATGPLMIILFVNNRASKWFVRKMVHVIARRLR